MTATSVNRSTPELLTEPRALYSFPVKGSTHIRAGVMVGLDSTGYLVEMTAATGLVCVGRAEEEVDNSSGNSGDLSCNCRAGTFGWAVSSIDQSNVGTYVYADDNQTVSDTSSSRSIAGLLVSLQGSVGYVRSVMAAGGATGSTGATGPTGPAGPTGPTGPASLESLKTGIAPADEARVANAVLELPLSSYSYREPNGSDRQPGPQLGFMLGDVPPELSALKAPDGQHVNLYAYAASLHATIREQAKRIDALESRLNGGAR